MPAGLRPSVAARRFRPPWWRHPARPALPPLLGRVGDNMEMEKQRGLTFFLLCAATALILSIVCFQGKHHEPLQDSNSRDANIVPGLRLPAASQPGNRAARRLPGLWRISHYCPCKLCCGKWASDSCATDPNRTVASGKNLRALIEANVPLCAAPKNIPFGTMLQLRPAGPQPANLPNGPPVVVEDRGGAIKGRRIDVFCKTHTEALTRGVYYATVEILP